MEKIVKVSKVGRGKREMNPVYPELPVYFRIEKNNKYIHQKRVKIIFLVCFRGKLHLQQGCKRMRKAQGAGDTEMPNVLAVQPSEGKPDRRRQSWIFSSALPASGLWFSLHCKCVISQIHDPMLTCSPLQMPAD